MYTSTMKTRIKEICEKNYGFSLLHENGQSLGKTFTFASVLELIQKIEELESGKIDIYPSAWYDGILMETGERVRFTQYVDVQKMGVGEWCNCIDKKNLEQKYCVENIKNGVYYFKKVWYDEEL